MIEVGEYVRTDNGIDRFLYKTKYDNGANKYVFEKASMSNPEYYVLKNSKNIIDLIEVGDYVNGIYIEENNGKYLETFELDVENSSLGHIQYLKIWKSDIETIVTKEQFTSMEYRLEENK